MLKRKIDKYLEEWKASVDKKPLIVKGARQACSFPLLTYLQLAPFAFLSQQFSQKRSKLNIPHLLLSEKNEKTAFFCNFL